jgi:threonine dehydrogenase-like Zn-dependent dehydrogenase
VKAITFAAPIPTYLLTMAAGAIVPRLFVGPHACTRYGDVADPVPPGDRWVTIRTRLGGICGSDLAIVMLSASPATSPFSSFPFVIGHENVGVVEAAGAGVRTLRPGDRVVANPLLPCAPRGIDPPCPACARRQPSRCERFTDGALPPGMMIGTTRGVGGSWGERFVAHEDQVLRVPGGVSDEGAVLTEPLACCVHAVRGALPAAGERVLVIGAGSIGLLTVAALRALVPGAEVTALARHAFQAEHATRLGAARALTASDTKALAAAAGARLLATVIGPPAAVGGFDRSYVCVTGAKAMEDALRCTRAGGTITLLGNARHLSGVDWTPLWLKELTLKGSVTYGAHPGAGGDAFHEALDLIASGRTPVAPLVTHTFPLADYAGALAAATGKSGAKSVKVAFRFDA